MFYRDATYMYILSKDYDYEVLGVLKKWLKIDGFLRESEVINILDGNIHMVYTQALRRLRVYQTRYAQSIKKQLNLKHINIFMR